MSEIDRIENIEKEFMAIVNVHLPRPLIRSHGSSGPKFHARLSEWNKDYSGSDYFYNGPLEFVHWTSVQSLLSIINYREFRLYNLHNSADNEEFRYAAELLKVDNLQIENSKKALYTLSFCKSDELHNPHLWSEYGNNYRGVAIRFKIMNNPQHWRNFMLSEVFYKLPSGLDKMIKNLEQLKQKFPEYIHDVDLGRLIGYYKKPEYSNEQEIRLSTYVPFTETDEYWKYCNTEFRLDRNPPRMTDYFGLKLFVNNTSSYLKSEKPQYDRRLILQPEYQIEKPLIQITDIEFGIECGIDNRDFGSFRTKLIEIMKRRLGYAAEVPLNLYRSGIKL